MLDRPLALATIPAGTMALAIAVSGLLWCALAYGAALLLGVAG